MSNDWFAVDKEGLAALLERRGKAAVVLELCQNSWDAPGVSRVDVTLTPTERGKAELVVTDDSPEGFTDLGHAFTLFARSVKVADAEKRGRFNLGEKLVLAVCDEATITSTTGGYAFGATGRRKLRAKRAAGSEFRAIIRLNREDVAEVEQRFHTLLPPAGVRTTLNGRSLLEREPVHTFTVALATEVAGEDGILRPTKRKATVRLFEPQGNEQASIYELGIPVVEWSGRWHIDVGQKVPLNFERDNVTPAYLRTLTVAVVNEMAERLTAEDATTTWVKAALSSPDISTEATTAIIAHRFGDKAVAFDPSDQQANQEAALLGYTVVGGRSLSKEEWAAARRADLLLPAGKVTPSNSTVDMTSDGKEPTPRDKWTPGQERMAAYAQALAKELIGASIVVDFSVSSQNFAAAFANGSKHLWFNTQRLGHRWFNTPVQAQVDELLLHEFAHDQVSNHLSEQFHDELCRLGAKMRHVTITLEDF